MSKQMQAIQGVYSVTAPVEMTNVFVQVQRSVTTVSYTHLDVYKRQAMSRTAAQSSLPPSSATRKSPRRCAVCCSSATA